MTTHRVVQWTTGNVARETVRAVLARPDLELVGAYAFSREKAGKDVADLCELERRSALAQAAATGGATLFGGGMNPGFAQLLAAVAAGISRDVRRLAMTESVDVSQFAGDANMEPLGWGRPLGDPGHAADVEAATAVFADGVDVLAALLGLGDGHVEPRCTVAFAAATKDLDLPGRRIAEGHVAGIEVRWEGFVAGRRVIELHQRWIMDRAIEPAWTVEHAYLVEVDGDPQVRLRLEIWPDQELATLTPEDVHAIGMRITGRPVVNAIPAVCAAPPRIRTYANLPPVSANLR